MLFFLLAVNAAFAQPDFATIEKKSGGRIGVSIYDIGTGQRWQHNSGKRFLMCSTFKWLQAAQLLKRVDQKQDTLERVLTIRKEDRLPYSPVTKSEKQLPAGKLAEASVQKSDNAAAMTLMHALGGPQGLTKFLRSMGDSTTRLDREEPALNTADGDKDTTTPDAIVDDLEKFLLKDSLSKESRERLSGWMLGTTTGDARIRAGAPAGWKVADKTGTCSSGTLGDIGVLFPPDNAPILIAVYIDKADGKSKKNEALIAEVVKAVLPELKR